MTSPRSGTYAITTPLFCVAITPDWMRTERVMESIKEEDIVKTESCEYVGRMLCALFDDR